MTDTPFESVEVHHMLSKSAIPAIPILDLPYLIVSVTTVEYVMVKM